MPEHEPTREQEVHEPPKGALLITVIYLFIIAILWANVYLQLLQRGLPQP